MRAGAEPGAPDPADQISWMEDLAHLHGDLGQVRVGGYQATPVIDAHKQPIPSVPPSPDHLALTGTHDGCSQRRADIDARVHLSGSENRMRSKPESGGDAPAG